jgi:hypothetical protein
LIERRKTLVDEDRTTTYITPNLLSPKKKKVREGVQANLVYFSRKDKRLRYR